MDNTNNSKTKGILIDVTKCTGCETCVNACVENNNLNPVLPVSNAKEDGLSGNRFTAIVQLNQDRFAKKSCLHCVDPGCVNACIAGAIKKTELGAVVYDPDICIGCRYCMLACPVGIPRYEWDKKLPYVRKCDMCYDRLLEGKIPACVEACPNGVLKFGDRSELLKEAKQIIKANPDIYSDHIYGESEFGGTSVIYITDVRLDKLGWTTSMEDRSITDYTWPVISKTPFIGGGMMAFLTGTLFIINRRMKLENERFEKEAISEPNEYSGNGKKSEKE